MLSTISEHIRQKFKVFFLTDNLLFNNKVIPVTQEHYQEIHPQNSEKTIAFIDGGQAEILSGGNLCLSFIRIFAQVMQAGKKISSESHEFYLLTTAQYRHGDIWYEGKLFPLHGPGLIHEEDLVINSNDASIRAGNERAPISTMTSMARRYAELSLAAKIKADYILLDGTLTPIFMGEEKYLQALKDHVSALAKTCSLFTTCGNSPTVLLQKLSPFQQWSYFVDGKTYFVKLHPNAKHVFRFEGNKDLLPHLLHHSSDALFLGYPYGLISADKMARVSNQEKNSLMMRILGDAKNWELHEYLNATNAHEILDRMG
ncbi:hypothetical protein HYX14_00440 [Candidatus Woesearchaeota archaeon]|nr:hypothetical protein [Candidatus Woesearchaeota archaeon]